MTNLDNMLVNSEILMEFCTIKKIIKLLHSKCIMNLKLAVNILVLSAVIL